MKQLEEQKGLISWFVHNHVAANLMMLMIIIAGTFSVYTITKKTTPDLFIPIITVTVALPGASPADIETGIIIPIESALDSLDGIDYIRSVANQDLGVVTLEINESYDINEVLNNVELNIDLIQTCLIEC